MSRSQAARGAVLLLALVLAAVLAGCNSVREKGRIELLDYTVRTYEKMLRWGEYREAAKYVRPREDEAGGERVAPEPVDYDALAPIRITGMRTLRRVLTTEQDAASILVNIEFYHNDYGIVKDMDYVENWYFDPDAGSWFLDNDLPDFAAAVGGEGS